MVYMAMYISSRGQLLIENVGIYSIYAFEMNYEYKMLRHALPAAMNTALTPETILVANNSIKPHSSPPPLLSLSIPRL